VREQKAGEKIQTESSNTERHNPCPNRCPAPSIPGSGISRSCACRLPRKACR
jgi:hypothetical protein